MNQYVGLLELICMSCPIPTAEVLQDVSVLYARLGKDTHVASRLFLRGSHLFVSHLFAAQRLSCFSLAYVLSPFPDFEHNPSFCIQQLGSVEVEQLVTKKTMLSPHLIIVTAPP